MKTNSKQKHISKLTCSGDVYTDIAEVMTIMGFKMNHCTARTVTIGVMKKIIKRVASDQGISINAERLNEVAQNENFQSSLAIIFDKIEHSRSS